MCNGNYKNETNQPDIDYAAIKRVINKSGIDLAFSEQSGVQLIQQDGHTFKDLNKNGQLDKYEDWRLPAEDRAKDLASKMTIEQIAGLMLYSGHQMIPAVGQGPFGRSTYSGKPYSESGAQPWELTDQQIKFLTEDNLRHILLTSIASPEAAARWNNQIQALAESIGLGIPANNSSDPRHGADNSKEFNLGAGGKISMWPEQIGLAASFDPDLVRRFGEIAASEYRALGITTALSPQIDLATDPRWSRYNGTFGECSQLAADMARAYCDGFQTSASDHEITEGWGCDSVNVMVKHWPGGGSGEAGRDAHFNYGKYAVYPGGNFKEHLKPFSEGAFALTGGTKTAAAVMPYYTISFNQDKVNNENVGNSYSEYLINQLLRGKYQYDGVVCTDWMITADEGPDVDTFSGKCWGTEKLTVAERHLKIIMAGVDQFGGNNNAAPVLEAYKIGVEAYGEQFMRQRFEQSAVRLLKNIFRVGLFENPYLDTAVSSATAGKAEYMQTGYAAQLKSVVMLKNKDSLLPLQRRTKVFIPKRHTPSSKGWFGNVVPGITELPVNIETARQYFEIMENPAEADCALVFIRGPLNTMFTGGYSSEDSKAGGNGYLPISLQYRPYTAEYARGVSLAGGDPLENFTNRSYRGKSVTTMNESDLDLVLTTRVMMGDKPVIVILNLERPAIVNEYEQQIQALLVDFGVQNQAIFDVLVGEFEPSGLLPFQIPQDMKTVEEQDEDVPFDMVCHTDSENHKYDFAYGLNWQGIINDQRIWKYRR